MSHKVIDNYNKVKFNRERELPNKIVDVISILIIKIESVNIKESVFSKYKRVSKNFIRNKISLKYDFIVKVTLNRITK